MKHSSQLIVPVFIPHAGCKHRCVFCDQVGITGSAAPPAPDEVARILAARLGPDTPHAVIAFYGGSFTCLPRELQDACLTRAGEFISRGYASHIRLSTRPDCMDPDVARFLAERGVGEVELGAQSMDDAVLMASARGHTASETVAAAAAVKAAGLRLGLQIMAGLPGDSEEGFMSTARGVIGLGPDFARIYPALVVKGAPLERLFEKGEYAPLSLADAVSICADASALFREAGIDVIRTGLQPSESLEAALVAGPYHPAFGHMVASELALRRMKLLAGPGHGTGHALRFHVNPSELSEYLGIRKSNIDALRRTLGRPVTIAGDPSVGRGGLKLAGPA